MSAGVTPSKCSLLLETERVDRTTLFPLSVSAYTHSYQACKHTAHTHLPLRAVCTLLLCSPACMSYVHMCFLSFLSLWTDLQASDLIWTISDTAWILNILCSFLEPWTSGACVFIHLLPKFDPLVILQVREGPMHTTRRSAHGLHTPTDCSFLQLI